MANAEKPLYNEIVTAIQERTTKLTEGLAKRLGPVGERVSSAEQMAAWKEMTPERIVEMAQREGPVNVLAYIREMRRREKLSGSKSFS